MYEGEAMEEFEEYVTFTVDAKDGTELLMAVMDEFDFENKHYVVGSIVEGDEIKTDGMFIFESIIDGDEFTVKKISREFEYNRIAKAYMEMDEE